MKNLNFQQKVEIFSTATAAGVMEREGPLGSYFDLFSEDDRFGASTWETAESQMVQMTLERALCPASGAAEHVDLLLGGDLLNQCTATAYGAAPRRLCYLGLYSACATFAEGLLLAASLIDGDMAKSVGVVTSSHFSTAERQYRFPLEYGSQRTPTAQRTVTGCGTALLRRASCTDATSLLVRAARIGRMIDSGVKDANHMGAAMAPAAADTLIRFLSEREERADEYDLILTGDLGQSGARLFCELCRERGVFLGSEYRDCGVQIFFPEQDTHAGGSGAACSALYLCGYLFKAWPQLSARRVLFIGTGALLSPLTVLQKQSILGVAHLLYLERGEKCAF